MMGLLGFLTALFLVAVIAVECLDLERPKARLAWGGLFLFGVPWLCFYAAGITGQPLFLIGVPLLYAVVGGGFLARLARCRRQEEQDLQASRGWRCPSCKTPNAAVNRLCFRCQTPRPSSSSSTPSSASGRRGVRGIVGGQMDSQFW